ncbi:MAG TPA: hypothetical protein VN442_05800 [Bryobacteraceae bacterium]|nr:hypothetical protein [Bryobacteraceae bacterium]
MQGNELRTRRRFLVTVSGAATAASMLAQQVAQAPIERRIAPAGPGAVYTPKVKAAFVRRKGDYGILWPGDIYDGKAALAKYRTSAAAAAKKMGLQLDMRADPILSAEEADQWVAAARAERPDGLFLIVLDRQAHAWPTAAKAADSGIPSVIFSPVGTAFTTNTAPLADRKGVFIASTDDFRQAVYGLKMLRAQAKLREMRFVVLQGKERKDEVLQPFGTRLRYVPARDFLDEYERTPVNAEVKALAQARIKGATRVVGATEQDVINGVKSYVVARKFLEREQGDGITMDCLGALGGTKVSLPCIAWSTMLDHGIPAACEADLGAAVTHALVQFLFDRPGFQQDPVPETARECLIGAHCTCPTRLAGFDRPPEPYYLSHHHGRRDAVPVPHWRVGQRVTVADVQVRGDQFANPSMMISAGKVVDNLSVPPSGGCVVSVMVQLDGERDLLAYPGFHQIFFYGDHKRDLAAYCKLTGIPPQLV